MFSSQSDLSNCLNMNYYMAYMFSQKDWFVIIILSGMVYLKGWDGFELSLNSSFRILVRDVDENLMLDYFYEANNVFAFIDRALDILEEINLSVSRKNKFSEAAYNKLLNNHLSLKYSQTGYLSSSNIISDGFYDYGRVSGSTNLCFSMCDHFFFNHDTITLQFYNHLT